MGNPSGVELSVDYVYGFPYEMVFFRSCFQTFHCLQGRKFPCWQAHCNKETGTCLFVHVPSMHALSISMIY